MKKIKTLAVAVSLLAGVSTAAALDTTPPDYKPLTDLVSQCYDVIKTKEGDYVRCIFFEYDRNGDSGWKDGMFRGKDLIEYRLLMLNEDGYIVWDKNPYIVIIDDDFDGYADREFVDNGEVKDGIFDEVNDLSGKKISMDGFNHKTYRK